MLQYLNPSKTIFYCISSSSIFTRLIVLIWLIWCSSAFSPGMEHNFNKIATLNQGTVYDYNSVMQYHRSEEPPNRPSTPTVLLVYWYLSIVYWRLSLFSRTAFSKNGQPTMIPIPNPNVSFGQATQMSQNDITRLNRLYKCCEYSALVFLLKNRTMVYWQMKHFSLCTETAEEMWSRWQL